MTDPQEIARGLGGHIASTLRHMDRTGDTRWRNAVHGAEALRLGLIERTRWNPPKWEITDLGRRVAAVLRGDK